VNEKSGPEFAEKVFVLIEFSDSIVVVDAWWWSLVWCVPVLEFIKSEADPRPLKSVKTEVFKLCDSEPNSTS
jgi:hypothetical protein